MTGDNYYVKRSLAEQIRQSIIITFDVIMVLLLAIPMVAKEIYRLISYKQKDVRGKLVLVKAKSQGKLEIRV